MTEGFKTNLEEAIYEKNRFVIGSYIYTAEESRGVRRHSREVTEQSVRFRNHQATGGSSDTSEGSENSRSFEELWKLGERIDA
ncbi:hypothetical protein Tco_1265764 [Tanacetum coccineum]